MLYLEDEDNVRPAWMPYKNDYRHLNLDELQTLEDCDEAKLWLNDRITDMHTWREQIEDIEHKRRLMRHISRALYLRDKLSLLRSDFWQEEKREFWAEYDAEMAARKQVEAADRDQKLAERAARAAAHAELLASHEAARKAKKEREHQEKLERIAAANDADREWAHELRKLFIEKYGNDEWVVMATEARARLEAKQAQEVGDGE